MEKNFDKAFEIVIGLEGRPTDDPHDPGGLTVWGLSTKYNPEVHIDMPITRAKEIYKDKYWDPAGCNAAPFPLDICLFDSQVNPIKGGNMEIRNKFPENWQEFLLYRAVRYMENSDPKYVKGHVFRCLRLFLEIKKLSK